MENSIVIQVVQGGFILDYTEITSAAGNEVHNQRREVFVSPRKLNQKVKDIIESLSLVSEER